jgi:FkbM family methyltransferase
MPATKKTKKIVDTTSSIDTLKSKLDLVEARPGSMYVYKNDQFVSKAIRVYGEYCHAEVDVMKMFYKEDQMYVDVGVNIGYHSLAVHKETGSAVVGFEPNPTHFAIAAENCKTVPVQLFNAALGSRKDTIMMTDVTIDDAGNYGETKQDDDAGTIEAQCITLDSLNLPDIWGMKIDVEGFELGVMKGAEKTIDKYRPVIFFEALGLDWTGCFDFLSTKGYKQYWVACLNTPLKNDTFIPKDPNNDPGFGMGGVTNIVAIPAEKPQIGNLMPVVQDETYGACAQRTKSYIMAF